MKLINNRILLGGLLVATVVSSCKKPWFDINQNPNQPVETNITADLIAPAALLNTANRTATSFGYLGNWLGFWCPGANYAPNVEEQSYNITTNFGAGTWGAIMDNSYDYQFMENEAAASGADFYRGMAKIMKAHNFAQIVDMYNSAPYFEALQGMKNIRPKYDDGKVVYEDLIKQIDTGIALIKNANIDLNFNVAKADIMFASDKTKWAKFGNTLKLRLLMHQANRGDRQAYITAEMAKIAAEGSGFLGTGQDAAVNPVFQSDKPNAYYATYGFTQTGTQATDFWRANVIVMDFLKTDADPRMTYFYKQVVTPKGSNAEAFTQLPPDTYRGNQYGLSINNVQYPAHTANYVSQVGGLTTAGGGTALTPGLIKGYAQPIWILTSVESMFLQAEAIERGFLTVAGTPADSAYKYAVRESFRWLNVGGGTRDTADLKFKIWYDNSVANASQKISWAAAPDKRRLMQYQKYMAMNGTNFLEAWTDYRRNGNYPAIPLSVNPGRTSPTLPYRLLFPQREIDLNTANVPTAGRSSGDQFTGKIWWMP